MKTMKEAFLEEMDEWVAEGWKQKVIMKGEPHYRLTPSGQAVARRQGMSYSDGKWRHWREIWELGNDEGQELDDPVPSREEANAAAEELVTKGLVERFRRPDGRIAYRSVKYGNAN